MAYIGNDLEVAFQSYLIIDDISGDFDGSQTSFTLNVNGAVPVPFPINPQQFGSSYNPDTVSKQPRSRYLQRAGNNLQSAGNTYSRF